MNPHRSFTMIRTVVVFISLSPSLWAATIVDFEDLTLANESTVTGDKDNRSFISHGISFTMGWNDQFNCCPVGFAYGNTTDLSTAGFANAYSAYSLPLGGGVGGTGNYAIGNNLQRGESIITLAEPSVVQGVFVTNTTYGYLAVAEGNDAGAGFVKGPLANGDWFKLEFIGKDQAGQDTGTVEFFLADFRGGNESIVDDWTWVDLTSLGKNVKSLEFEMNSTDVGQFGMNTPAYFAMDNLTIAIPEPNACLLCTLSVILLLRWRFLPFP